jgi:hypothetical protein
MNPIPSSQEKGQEPSDAEAIAQMSRRVRLQRDAALICLTERLHPMVTLVNSLLHASIFAQKEMSAGLCRVGFTFAAYDLSSQLNNVWFGALKGEEQARLKKLYSLDKIFNPHEDSLYDHWLRIQKESEIGQPERILIKSILKKVGCHSVRWENVSIACHCSGTAPEVRVGVHVDTHKNCIHRIPLLCPKKVDSIVRQKSSSGVLVLPCPSDRQIIPAFTLSFQIVGSRAFDDVLSLKSQINDPR